MIKTARLFTLDLEKQRFTLLQRTLPALKYGLKKARNKELSVLHSI
jgi:hypothetical protein